jgi:sorbitol-specific phosphotransferase system component IIA
MVTLEDSISINEDVLVQELSGEFILLNLENEEYYGLDDVGSSIWSFLRELGSLQLAFDRLLERYDVEPQVLKQDLLEIVEKWIQNDLVSVADS